MRSDTGYYDYWAYHERPRIVWPNGVLQTEFEIAADTAVLATQRLKGSCPWLFAWNGREMGFVTDLIWRSPLGLRINAQATADDSARLLRAEGWTHAGEEPESEHAETLADTLIAELDALGAFRSADNRVATDEGARVAAAVLRHRLLHTRFPAL